MQSHQTDETTQASGAGLSEQDLAAVSGGALSPEDIQIIQQETRAIMQGKKNPLDPKTLGSASFVGTLAGFGAHAGGETLHSKFNHH